MASLCRGYLLFVHLLLLPVALLPCAHGAPADTGKIKISAVFVFGDSIVDPGNNNNRLTEAKADFPPYGQDFPGGVATGRFSNGKVPGDMFASGFGIKKLLPPYIGDDLQLSDLLTGVVFASGGSGYDPLTSIPAAATSSTGQLELFLEYKERLKSLVGEEETARVISEGIYFTVMGANDLANNYFLLPLRRHQYDLPSYINFLVSSAVNFTMKLNEMGARRIGFIGIPPVGCCPSQRILGSRECFKEVAEGCCGSTVLNAAIFIKNHHACPNVNDFIFWDSFHPTEKAYSIVVDKLFQQNMHDLM
ncbi:GDSL esterase/lipase EXL1-like [Lolium rigidum]|uniref:GDSL esterase/lipase EXL1-like n=1 Tax=Lolium rigidum TaxID=89674 RepID=UPI001F5E318B|nr:GDSL esterase/lipase EXL1-like [Lolium rigidum]